MKHLIRQIGRFITDLFKHQKRAHHEIAIMAWNRDEAAQTIRSFSRARIGEVVVLQPRDDTMQALLDGRRINDGQSDTESFNAWYIRTGRKSRRRRWRFHLPPINGGNSNQEKPPWNHIVDTIIISWPYRDLMTDQNIFHERSHWLFAKIGDALERGRLKRVMIVISGVEQRIGPHHGMQARIDLSHKGTLQWHIKRLLRAGKYRGGNPYGDPHWRDFLLKRLAGNANFAQLANTLQASLNRTFPIFFLSGAGVDEGTLASLLCWIDGRCEHPQMRQRRKISSILAAMMTAVVSTAIILLGLILHDLKPLSTTGSIDSLTAQMNDQIENYGMLYGLPNLMLGNLHESNLEKLQEIRHLLISKQREESLIRGFRRISESDIPMTMDERAEAVNTVLAHYFQELEWRKVALQRGYDVEASQSWRSSILSGAYASKVLSTYFELSVDSLIVHRRLQGDIDSVLEERGNPALCTFLDSLTRATTPLKYYKLLEESASMMGDVQAWQNMQGFVWKIPVDSLCKRIRCLSDKELVERKDECLDLANAILLVDSLMRAGTFPMDPSALAEALQISEEINEYFRRRTVTIRLTYLGNTRNANWHSDVRHPESSRITPAIYSSEENACIVTLSAAPGDLITIRFNWSSRDHIGGSRFCRGTGRILQILLDSETLEFSDGEREVKIEIENWPLWRKDDQHAT